MNSFARYFSIFVFAAAVAACGGSGDEQSGGVGGGEVGSGAGGDSAARIDAGNAEDLGIAATEAATQAVEYQALPNFGFKSDTGIIEADLSRRIAARTAAAPSFGCFSGSVNEVNNPDGSVTVTFTMCDIGFGLVLDGAVESSSSVSGNITTVVLEYVDFSFDFLGDVVVIDFSASCDTDNATMETSCSFAGVEGFDGRIYDFSDSSVTGDEFSGYSVSATVVDPDHGSFTISTTTPILFGCANGQPMSGELQFTDGAGVLVSVIFNDCASYTVSYNGIAEVYNW